VSWRHAPLYVAAHDLAALVLRGTAAWPPEQAALRDLCTAAACALPTWAAMALTFPDRRARSLLELDEAVLRLREHLRLARALGLVSPGWARDAADRLDDVGRMTGGWRRRLRANEGAGEEDPGLRRREADDPRRELEERGQEGPLGQPQQERPRQPERQPGLPPGPLAVPEPAAAPQARSDLHGSAAQRDEGPEQARIRRRREVLRGEATPGAAPPPPDPARPRR
jgi:hypothetical protein